MNKWIRWGLASLMSMSLMLPMNIERTAYALVNVQDDIQDDLYQVDAIVNDRHVSYKAFYPAYLDMKELASTFELQDLIMQDVGGTTLKEFEEHVHIKQEGKKQAITEDIQVIVYTYPAEEDEDYEDVELLVYFKDERLAYLGILAKQKAGEVELPNLHFMQGDTLQAWLGEDPLPKMEQLAEEDFQVVGLSHMVFDGGALNTLLIPNVQKDKEMIDTVVFYDYTIMNSISDEPVVVAGMGNQLMLDTSILWASAAVSKQVNTGDYNFR